MLILNEAGLRDRAAWERAGYALPGYDREAMIQRTKTSPVWAHFGAGNIFRAFQANAAQRLLNEGLMESGIVAVEGYDYEVVEKGYRPSDEYSILVTLKADGSVEKTVIGSIAESRILDSDNAEEYAALKRIFENPSLQMASFTITEKGYSLTDGAGKTLPAVEKDYAAGPDRPGSYIGKVTSLLYARYLAGALPIAMVSMDNCSHNGDKLKAAVTAFTREWTQRGLAERGFADYIADAGKVSFPWSMIDKITPRPDASVEAMLKKDGLQGLEPVVTAKGTYIAPFVNAEESEYLVIEDAFPNGHPPLEKAGIIFTDRQTVDRVEKMKVCTCLNPLHTALAVFGCLLGYQRIYEEMRDPVLRKMAEIIGYREGLPVVTDPGVIRPKEFIDTVVSVRLPNPFMPDSPQRIATDTSQKLAIRFGETVKAYLASPALNVAELKLIPAVFAGWFRYLMAVDDEGKAFTPSPDPLLESASQAVKGFRAGHAPAASQALTALLPLMKNERIFGVDLEKAGLSDRVAELFARMTEGPGAVRKTLRELVEG